MLKVAILGANGFIGSRAVEMFHLMEIAAILPVVRAYSSLARSARFNLDYRIADACDRSMLCRAFAGCDVVINCIVGDPPVITSSARAAYQAANDAGVKRMIYLSSAAVHGLSPAPATTEDSPLFRQPLPYCNAKAKAERTLLKLRETSSTEIVILRPSIVYGPRSRWTAGLASQLLTGTSYLINGGNGICNSIYVDNLVEAIRLSLSAANCDRQVFLLGDEEQVTWADFYRPIAQALGIEFDEIASLPAPEFRQSIRDLIRQVWAGAPVQKLLPLVPAPMKRRVKAALKAFWQQEPVSEWSLSLQPRILPDREMTMLQQCSYKLPSDKANQILGYKPAVSFAEGCRRSVGWLEFAGYPVKK
jgi:nucleoside-diphosphate-sugar epimerase